jgi:hypothetical protein
MNAERADLDAYFRAANYLTVGQIIAGARGVARAQRQF